jgi:hypothetical protein
MQLEHDSLAFLLGATPEVTVSESDVPPRRNTKAIGQLSEIMVMAALARAGYLVSVPFGEDHRYDLVVEKDGVLSRVQVKTGRLRKGAIVFSCYSSHTHRDGPSCRPYVNEIEFFGVYCPELDSAYLVPIEDAARLSGALRVDTPRNGQTRKVRWASPYLLPASSNTGDRIAAREPRTRS